MKRNSEKAVRDGSVTALALAAIAVLNAFVDLNPEQYAALTALATVGSLLGYRLFRDLRTGQPD